MVKIPIRDQAIQQIKPLLGFGCFDMQLSGRFFSPSGSSKAIWTWAKDNPSDRNNAIRLSFSTSPEEKSRYPFSSRAGCTSPCCS